MALGERHVRRRAFRTFSLGCLLTCLFPGDGSFAGPTTGACCDRATGLCQDGGTSFDCQEEWTPDVTCSALDPPCGGAMTGACCDGATGFCQDGVTSADCQEQWTSGVTCAALNPPCSSATTGACCDEATGACAAPVIQIDCAIPLAWTEGAACEDIACTPPPIPAVTHWGIVVMCLLILASGTIVLRRSIREDARS